MSQKDPERDNAQRMLIPGEHRKPPELKSKTNPKMRLDAMHDHDRVGEKKRDNRKPRSGGRNQSKQEMVAGGARVAAPKSKDAITSP